MKADTPKKTEQVMQSLNDLQPAEASPFLYRKIRNRLQRSSESLPLQLVWRLAGALVIVAILNVVTLLKNDPASRVNHAEAVATEYTIYLPQSY